MGTHEQRICMSLHAIKMASREMRAHGAGAWMRCKCTWHTEVLSTIFTSNVDICAPPVFAYSCM